VTVRAAILGILLALAAPMLAAPALAAGSDATPPTALAAVDRQPSGAATSSWRGMIHHMTR
jgi:hypothetical protein